MCPTSPGGPIVGAPGHQLTKVGPMSLVHVLSQISRFWIILSQKKTFPDNVLRLLRRSIFALRCYHGVTLRVHQVFPFGYTLGIPSGISSCVTFGIHGPWITVLHLSVVPYTRGTTTTKKKTTNKNFHYQRSSMGTYWSGLWVLLHTKTKGEKLPMKKSRTTTELNASAWVRTTSSPERT